MSKHIKKEQSHRLSLETELILLSSRINANGIIQSRIREILNYPLDWSKLKEIASFHRVLPFLYLNLKNYKNLIPEEVFALIQNTFFYNFKRNTLLEREILDILKIIQVSGLKLIFLKGFAFLYLLYQDPGLRIMVDIDLLVKEKDLIKIKEILLGQGYRTGEERHRKSEEIFQTALHFAKNNLKNQPILIDLHWKLLPSRPYRLNLPLTWERVQRVKLGQQEFLALSNEDNFLFSVLHVRRHVRELTLNFIVDIAELLNFAGNDFDWKYINSVARKNHCRTAVYFSLYLAKDLLNAQVAEEILKGFQPDLIKRYVINRIINRHNFFHLKRWKATLIRILLFDNTRDFIFYLWRVSFLERFIYGKVLKEAS